MSALDHNQTSRKQDVSHVTWIFERLCFAENSGGYFSFSQTVSIALNDLEPTQAAPLSNGFGLYNAGRTRGVARPVGVVRPLVARGFVTRNGVSANQ